MKIRSRINFYSHSLSKLIVKKKCTKYFEIPPRSAERKGDAYCECEFVMSLTLTRKVFWKILILFGLQSH